MFVETMLQDHSVLNRFALRILHLRVVDALHFHLVRAHINNAMIRGHLGIAPFG